MSDQFLTPQTTMALMNASQSDTHGAAEKLQKAKLSGKDAAKIEDAAREFEAVFIAEMMKPMFEGISTEAPFGGGKGEEVFRSFMLQEYGKLTAKTGSIGIADHVKQAMIQMQEQANNDTSTE